ncbi:MAG: nicotinate-nucleotide adenylyltransferase [Alphaproteobacteria bacterium]
MARLRVGLLGGSFNPAHDGHRHVSLWALRALRLDQVWWLISPQNPLKPAAGMAPLAQRMASARAAARHPAIRVSDIEDRLGTRYTVDTVAALCRRHRDIDFVWLMGADILVQLPRWRRWTDLTRMVPIAVLDRPGYAYAALAGRAAQRLRRFRVRNPGDLAQTRPPAWAFLWGRRHTASATEIRARDRC